MGVAPYVVEKMLNHTFDGMMSVYNHATYDIERRGALNDWATWLSGLAEIHPADVLPLRSTGRQGFWAAKVPPAL